jgi:aldose 1-epimerase
MSISLTESKLGKFKTLILKDDQFNCSTEIALQGATLLNYYLPIRGQLYNIIDGFSTEAEFEHSRGARSWIMAPFSNRIENGEYKFLGNNYRISPIPPRTQVIHGFTFYHDFKIHSFSTHNNYAELILFSDCLKPDSYIGYPFRVDVYIKYIFEGYKLSIEVIAENLGETKAPFGTGWHPYFKTSDNGIEDLVLEINAKKIILTDNNSIPLHGKEAYGELDFFPKLDFRKAIDFEKRRINKRKVDTCYAELATYNNGFAISSIIDDEQGIKINVFQKEGMVLAFSGDSLRERNRKSIAIEPVQFMTNVFNRTEFEREISILPGTRKSFLFGVDVISEL